MPKQLNRNEPISEITAQKYISFLRRKGVIIVEPKPIQIWSSTVSERSILHKANEWVKELESIAGSPPYFFLLNLGVDDSGEKHAIVVAFDLVSENSKGNTISGKRKCHVHYFDPNGAIDFEKGMKAPLGKGLRIFIKILDQVVKILEEKYNCNEMGIIDDMEQIPNINTVGQGNCNALSLWYITNKFMHGCKVYDDIRNLSIEMKRNNKKTIDKINTDIINLKLLG
jgi:hypothetical protein